VILKTMDLKTRDAYRLKKGFEQPFTLRGSEYARAVQELNKAID